MQPNNEQLMTYGDLLALANKLVEPILAEFQEVKKELKEIKEAQKPQEETDLVWRTAQDLARNLNNGKGIPLSTARNLIAMPNFPKNIYGKRGKNKTGPWRANEVIQFFRIYKNKV